MAAVCRFARPSGVVLFLAGVISAIVVALLWLVVTAYNTRSIQSAPPATADQGVSTPGGSNEVPAPARSRAASTGLPSAVQVNVAQANLNEGDRLWHAERPGQAVDCWLRASRSAPGSRPSDAAGSRLAEVAEQAYRSGESYYRAGDLARARELLDAARRARPGSAWSQRADALWNQIATPLSPP